MTWVAGVGGILTLIFGWWLIRLIRQSGQDDLRRAIAEKEALRMAEAAKGVYRAGEAHERRLHAIHSDPSDADLGRMLSEAPSEPSAAPSGPKDGEG